MPLPGALAPAGPNRHDRRKADAQRRQRHKRVARRLRQLEHDARYVSGLDGEIRGLRRYVETGVKP